MLEVRIVIWFLYTRGMVISYLYTRRIISLVSSWRVKMEAFGEQRVFCNEKHRNNCLNVFYSGHFSSILLKEETDFINPQLLWNHIKSEIFVKWCIDLVYCTSLICLWNIFFHIKRQFLWKYPNPETVIVLCFNAFAHAQSTYFPIEDRRHGTL